MKRVMAILFGIVLLGVILGVGLDAHASTYLVWTGEYNESHADTWVLFRNLWTTGFKYMGFVGNSYFAPSSLAIKSKLSSIDVYAGMGHSGDAKCMVIKVTGSTSSDWCTRDDLLKCNPPAFGWACDDVYNAMNERQQPLRFAFVGGCEAMATVDYPSFADAFTKGGQLGSVVVGWRGLSSPLPFPEWWSDLWYSIQMYYWEQTFINYLALGYPVRQALFSADSEYSTMAQYSYMFGDGRVNLNGVNHDTPGLMHGVGSHGHLWANLNFDNDDSSNVQVDMPYSILSDLPIVGDWDGDGWDEIGAFRPSDKRWHLDFGNDGDVDENFAYGASGDIPITGDWNNNGGDTPGVYRAPTFYLKNSLSGGAADITFHFGTTGDLPLSGDWDGDGDDTIGVYRPTTRRFYLKNTLGGGSADISFIYGAIGDIPIMGDWDGDGIDTPGVYRPSTGMWYLRNTNSGGGADEWFEFHDCTTPLDPIVGFWQPPDGDDEMMIAGGSSSSSASCHECTALDIQQLKVYPNPTQREAVTFQVLGRDIQSIEVKLFDLSGQLIWSSGYVPGNQISWELVTQDGEQVANGIYLYSVDAQGNDGSVWTSKIGKLLVLK